MDVVVMVAVVVAVVVVPDPSIGNIFLVGGFFPQKVIFFNVFPLHF